MLLLFTSIANILWAFQQLPLSNNINIAAHQSKAHHFLFTTPYQRDSAEAHLFACDKLHQRNVDGLPFTYWLLAYFYAEKNDQMNAEIYAHKYLQSSPRQAAYSIHSLLLLGDAAQHHQKYSQAITHYQSALQLLCQPSLDTAALVLPKAEQIRDAAQALEILIRRTLSLTAQQRLDDAQSYQHWLFCVELVEKSYEQQAFNPYYLSFSCSPPCSDKNLADFNRKAELVYTSAFQAALRRYSNTRDGIFLEDAFLIAERHRNLYLKSQITNPTAFFNISDSLLENKKKLETQYQTTVWAELNALLGNATTEAQTLKSQAQQTAQDLLQLQTQRSEKYPLYADWCELSRVASVKDVQNALPNDSSAYLSYHFYHDSLLAFVVDKNSVNIELLPIEQTPKGESFAAQAHQLYLSYFPKKLPAHIRHLVLSGNLIWEIPMETWLSASTPDNADYRHLPYLLRRYAFSYQLSATVWLHQQSRSRLFANYQMLGLGAVGHLPAPDSQSVTQQLTWLSDNYKGYFPADAHLNDWQVYLSEYGFLHIATPFSAGLSMQLNDAKWTVTQLQAEQVRAALLCFDGYLQTDSLLPAAAQNADKMGALYHWAYSGAASMLVPSFALPTQWQTRVVSHFYDFLEQGLPKDEALRRAQLAHLEMAPQIATQPSFWANHSLWGDTLNVAPAQRGSRIWWYIIPIALMVAIGWWTMRGLRQRRRF